MPLLAPVAVVALCGNAAAIIVKPDPLDSNNTDTLAACDHPSDNRLYFRADLFTGDESGPEGYDIYGMELTASDDGADENWLEPEAMAKRLRVTYGILDHKQFVPTSAVFYAGNSFKYDGEYESNDVFTDVQAVRFDVDWKVVNSPATRTLSCVIKLDKYLND